MSIKPSQYIKAGMSPAYLESYREIFNQVEYLDPRLYKNASRYKNLRRIQDDTTKKIYHENWIQKIIETSENDSYYTVTKAEEGRLDIISNMYYNTPKYWWVVALANYIIDPFDIPVGTYLRIPPLISLYNNGGVLSGK